MRIARVLSRLNLGGPGHVDSHEKCFHPMQRQQIAGGSQPALVDVGQSHVHAFGGERERHGAPQAARGAGHRSHFSAQLAHRHECHSMDAPPTTIKLSMKSTCSLAPTRVTNQAATALPGMLATPITMTW